MSVKKRKSSETTQKPNTFSVSTKAQNIIFIILLFFISLFVNKETALNGKITTGTDVLGSIEKMNIAKTYEDQTGEDAFWNPSIFGGMPIYNEIAPKAFSVDTILNSLNDYFGKVGLYYFIAALGLYLFLLYLKVPPLGAFLGALIFILIPQFKGVGFEGHFKKLRAIMLIPWVGFAGKYFIDKRTLFSSMLFALAFGLEIRTGHYQIVFYSALLVFAIGVYPFIKNLLNKEYMLGLKSVGLLVLALVLALGMAAQPLLLNKEYLPYSKRGKETIHLSDSKDKVQEQGKNNTGVSLDYATQWSTYPLELLRWVVPHAYGGFQGEEYHGDKYSQLEGRQLPNYWGYMPFHTLFDYMGLVTLILALIALVYYRKNPFVISLLSLTIFLTLLSFGRHMEWFYAIFYNYLPYFNKFRVPSIAVSMTYFVVSLLAGLGIKALIENKEQIFKNPKKIYYIIGGFAILGILLFLFKGSFEYLKSGENYNAQVKAMLIDIRKDYFTNDLIRYFILLAVTAGLIWGYLSGKLKASLFVGIIIIVAAYDLYSVQSIYTPEYTTKDTIKNTVLAENKVETSLEADKDLFRIFPLGDLLNNNRWSYRFQNIGGYSAIKMHSMEELVENCYYGFPGRFPINFNIAKFMNVKYFVLPQPIQHPDLQLVAQDPANKLFAYKYNNFMKRAFFVDSTVVIEDPYDRLKKINDPSFDPATTAIVEKPVEGIKAPDSSTVTVTGWTPNNLKLDVYTDSRSLLVVSEVYYPPAWKALVDGQETEIYRTDHSIQSIVVEKGKHTVELVCEPDSYFYYKNISVASVSIIYLIIFGSLFWSFVLPKFKK